MPFEKSVMRFAHSNGLTHCCYTEDGSHIITSGSDGDIRIWNGIHDDDPVSNCVGEFVLAVTHYGRRILVSTDLNTVQALTFPEGDRDGTEFRFTAAVTSIRVDSKYIVAGSEDTIIKGVDIEKQSEPFELTGHEGPILKLDTHAGNEWLASGGGDGTIRVWDLKTKKELKCISGLEKAKSFYTAKSYLSPCFEPAHCKTMAYCHRSEIVIVDTVNYETVSKLRSKRSNSDWFTVCRYSTCGKYLAAGTSSGEICVWHVRSGEAVEVISKDDAQAQSITSIEWNPVNSDELAYTDNTGQLGTVTEDGTSARDDDDEALADKQDDMFDGVGFVDDEASRSDDDNENCVSLERLKNETMKRTAFDDEIDDLLEDQTNRPDSAVGLSSRATGGVVEKIIPLQPAFQPAETPRQLEHRYMVWNSVGLVRAHTSDAENSIEVEFHDASVHHSIHMSNYLHHTMASLSTTVLALAGETPSKLVCIALGAGSREWSISMPDCEEIQAIVATDKLVAVATDALVVRIFSVMGNQREEISLPGPVLTMSGHGNRIVVVYHMCPPSTNKFQPLKGMLIEVIGLGLRCKDITIPVGPDARMTWFGCTDRGSPAMANSKGIVQCFNVKENFWMRICDTTIHTKNASDMFFVLDVCESSQIVRAILCRGAAFPVTTPKPMVHELAMQGMQCELESEKSQLEESMVRYSKLGADNAEQKIKEVAIKLFALACRSEMESRAKNLIEMIASPGILPLAIKYASKLGRIHLAEKLNELTPMIEEFEKEQEKEQHVNEGALINMVHECPLSANLLLSGPKPAAAITPKPLLISSQQRRNPFKRGPGASGNTTPKSNPLSHLTSKAVGFNDSPCSSPVPIAVDADDTPSDPTEAQPKNGSAAPTFMSWFAEHKESLQAEFPDLIAAELTKQAMRRFKAQVTNGTSATGVNKRKLTDDPDDAPAAAKGSGVSKLARFGFSKN